MTTTTTTKVVTAPVDLDIMVNTSSRGRAMIMREARDILLSLPSAVHDTTNLLRIADWIQAIPR